MRNAILTLTLLLLPGSILIVDPFISEESEQEKILRDIRSTEFSIENLHTYLELMEAPDPKIIMSQFILETGWFTSKLFIDGNNLAGMKVPSRRDTKASGTIYGFASYSHWTDSVDDFLLWLDFHSLSEGYADHLQSIGYAENPEYYTKIMNIYSRLEI